MIVLSWTEPPHHIDEELGDPDGPFLCDYCNAGGKIKDATVVEVVATAAHPVNDVSFYAVACYCGRYCAFMGLLTTFSPEGRA